MIVVGSSGWLEYFADGPKPRESPQGFKITENW